MTMADFNYWQEAVGQSFDEHGIVYTREQVAAIAKDMEGAHQEHGQTSYQPPDPVHRELAETKAALAKERDVAGCRACKGRGWNAIDILGRISRETCIDCDGRGAR